MSGGKEGEYGCSRVGSVVYSPEDCRKAFTGYVVFRELHPCCLEHHKLGDEEQWEIRLVRPVEVMVWRMSHAVFQ